MVSCYRPQDRIVGVEAALCDHLVRLLVGILQKSRHKATVVWAMAKENGTDTTLISVCFHNTVGIRILVQLVSFRFARVITKR